MLICNNLNSSIFLIQVKIKQLNADTHCDNVLKGINIRLSNVDPNGPETETKTSGSLFENDWWLQATGQR